MNYWLDQTEMWTDGRDYVIAHDGVDAIDLAPPRQMVSWWRKMDVDENITYVDTSDIINTKKVSWILKQYGRGVFYCSP